MASLSPDVLKAAVAPLAYYSQTLPALPARRRSGWVDGGLCPFHEDRHAGNFRVNLDSGAYVCFACDAKGGDIIAFHRALHGLGFREAVADLSNRYLAGRIRS